MSSDASFEVEDAPTIGIERPRRDRVQQLERQVLCERIEQLETELAQERRRREQIVEQYEQLLDERSREHTDRDRGLLDRLF